jgi:hypothetical protein
VICFDMLPPVGHEYALGAGDGGVVVGPHEGRLCAGVTARRTGATSRWSSTDGCAATRECSCVRVCAGPQVERPRWWSGSGARCTTATPHALCPWRQA